jgi:hypothetical protein
MEPCIAAVHNPTQGRAFSFGDGNRSRERKPNAASRYRTLNEMSGQVGGMDKNAVLSFGPGGRAHKAHEDVLLKGAK